jgi:hypothetical protein
MTGTSGSPNGDKTVSANGLTFLYNGLGQFPRSAGVLR